MWRPNRFETVPGQDHHLRSGDRARTCNNQLQRPGWSVHGVSSLEVAARIDDDRCAASITGAVFRRRAVRVSSTGLSAAGSSLVLSPADSLRLIRDRRRRGFRRGWPGRPCRFADGGRFSRGGRLRHRRRLDRNEPAVVAENDETEGERSARRNGCQSAQQVPLLAGHAFGCHWSSSLSVPAAVSGSRATMGRPRRPAP